MYLCRKIKTKKQGRSTHALSQSLHILPKVVTQFELFHMFPHFNYTLKSILLELCVIDQGCPNNFM